MIKGNTTGVFPDRLDSRPGVRHRDDSRLRGDPPAAFSSGFAVGRRRGGARLPAQARAGRERFPASAPASRDRDLVRAAR